MKKRLLALVLALVTVLTLLPVGAVAEEKSESVFSYYTALGDSLPWHIEAGLPETWNQYGFRNNTYPAMIFEHYGLTAGFYGPRCGWRTNEILACILDDYDGDDYTNNFLLYWGGMNAGQVNAMGEQYREAIKRSDLITLNFGSNEVLGTLTYVTRKEMETHTAGTKLERATLDAIDRAMAKEDASDALMSLLQFTRDNLQNYIHISTLTKDLSEAILEFPTAWDTLIAEIRKLNPSALLVVASMIDPQGISNVESFLGHCFFDMLNGYMRGAACRYDNYIFVDSGVPDMTGTRDGSHLGTVGHREVADNIIAAIDSYLPCRHQHCSRVNVREAKGLLPGYTGDLRCDDCGEVLEYGKLVSITGISVPTMRALLNAVFGPGGFNSNVFTAFTSTMERLTRPLRLAILKY